MNFGILGFGKMGKIRYETLQENPEFSVRKVYDPVEQGIPTDVKRVSDYREILEDKDIQAIFVCSPNYLNCKYVMESLKAGKHVFCEKPPGISVAELQTMIELEQQNPHLKLMFGFNHR